MTLSFHSGIIQLMPKLVGQIALDRMESMFALRHRQRPQSLRFGCTRQRISADGNSMCQAHLAVRHGK